MRILDVSPRVVHPPKRGSAVRAYPLQLTVGREVKQFSQIHGFAFRQSVVAFAAALDGTDVRDGMHALVADKNDAGLLSALNRLADDPDLSSAIGHAARQLARERYDWRTIAQQLEHHLLHLVDRGAP